MPAWVLSQIEKSLYDFFWNYKRHLTTKDILALLLKECGSISLVWRQKSEVYV